jgi:glycosyltransferase involved in cell wall biosynthesis
MSDKKVKILISTYNGKKYIEQQLESIFEQTYKNIEILIRDDGSTDGTIEILKEYEKNGKIELVTGENLGIWKSVFWLAANTGEADYYSFADQDDIWMSDKIERAVNALEKTNQENPALYFCNFDFYDEEMVFSSHRNRLGIELTFINSLVNFIAYGFTCVINENMRHLFLQMPTDVQFYHDYLFLILGTAFGNVIYEDDYIGAKYRRHGKNVSISNENALKLLIWRIKNFLFSDEFKYKEKWRKFSDIYEEKLDDTNRKILKLFTEQGYSLRNAMKRAFYTKRYREAMLDELALRVVFFVGKL